jgi:1-acyl-sn-glycerol-3-phosphate acyltransferase
MIAARSALFAVWFFFGTFLATVVGSPVLLLPQERVMRYAQGWARLMLFGLRIICGVRYVITGEEHLPKDGPFLIASMHQSAFDTIVWIAYAPRFTYVLKRELTRIPFFNMFLTKTGMIAVDRHAGAAAMRTLLRAADDARRTERQIVIFPEGTRVAPGEVGELMPGVAAIATRTGLPVIPVVTDSGYRWGRRSFLKHPGVIHVAVQPPLPAGLPRAALLTRLAAIYAEAPRLLREAVDNSVNSAPKMLPDQPR